MKQSKYQPFSSKWMLASMGIFIGVELFLGGFIGEVVIGRMMSLSLRFLIQGLLNLLSFFIGGFIIGVVSPGLRVHEPAIGAFLSVAFMLFLSLFTPYSFIRFSLTKMLLGGGVAFCLALTGAKFGERLTGHRISS